MKAYIVVPAAKVPKDIEGMSGVVVAASKNGWMNDELTKTGLIGFGKISVLLNVSLSG